MSIPTKSVALNLLLNKKAIKGVVKRVSILPYRRREGQKTLRVTRKGNSFPTYKSMTKIKLKKPKLKSKFTFVKETVKNLVSAKTISRSTASIAIAGLIRKGAANARARDTMAVEIRCPDTGTITEVSRYDIGMALYRVVKHKTIRKLTEAMASDMLTAALGIIRRDPTADLKGDLANKINRRLLAEAARTPPDKTPPKMLTREEEVCACTYAQHLPNLNELARSDRLKRLLEEDLLQRKPQRPNKVPKKGFTASTY